MLIAVTILLLIVLVPYNRSGSHRSSVGVGIMVVIVLGILVIVVVVVVVMIIEMIEVIQVECMLFISVNILMNHQQMLWQIWVMVLHQDLDCNQDHQALVLIRQKQIGIANQPGQKS